MRQTRRAAIAASLCTGAMFVASALPAHAYVSEEGWLWRTSCTQPADPWSRSYSDGWTETWGPGSARIAYQNNTFLVRTRQGSYNGGHWEVRVTNGALDDAATYAWCRNP